MINRGREGGREGEREGEREREQKSHNENVFKSKASCKGNLRYGG